MHSYTCIAFNSGVECCLIVNAFPTDILPNILQNGYDMKDRSMHFAIPEESNIIYSLLEYCTWLQGARVHINVCNRHNSVMRTAPFSQCLLCMVCTCIIIYVFPATSTALSTSIYPLFMHGLLCIHRSIQVVHLHFPQWCIVCIVHRLLH